MMAGHDKKTLQTVVNSEVLPDKKVHSLQLNYLLTT